MKKEKSSILLFSISILCLFCIPNLYGQTNISKEINHKEIALKIINQAPTCALITINENGFPISRMMQTLATEKDFIIWMATKPNTKKVKEIKVNPQVNIYYQEQNGSGYVSLLGHAELVNDAEAKSNHWKDGWEVYYPDIEKDMILIKIIPELLEMVSYANGIVSTTDDWAAIRIDLLD